MFLLLTVLLAAPAAAQPAGYQPTYSKGVKLEKNGQVVDALAAFESIPIEKRDFNTRLHIAGCKEKLNRLLASRDDYEAIRTDPKADSATVDTAAAALSDVVPRIPIVRLTVTAADVSVRLDDAVVVAGDHRVDPGVHRVVARRGEEVVFERKLDLAESSTTAVTVDAPAPPVVAPPKVTPPPPVAETPPSSRLTGLPFYVGAGVALLAGGGAYFLSTSASRRVEDNCREQLSFECDEEAAGAGRVRTWQTVSVVSAGLAVVAIGIGIAIDVTKPAKQAASVHLNIGGMLGGAGFQLVGRF